MVKIRKDGKRDRRTLTKEDKQAEATADFLGASFSLLYDLIVYLNKRFSKPYNYIAIVIAMYLLFSSIYWIGDYFGLWALLF